VVFLSIAVEPAEHATVAAGAGRGSAFGIAVVAMAGSLAALVAARQAPAANPG
jgi:hypothetical protein